LNLNQRKNVRMCTFFFDLVKRKNALIKKFIFYQKASIFFIALWRRALHIIFFGLFFGKYTFFYSFKTILGVKLFNKFIN
jgi:hypothetical protein